MKKILLLLCLVPFLTGAYKPVVDDDLDYFEPLSSATGPISTLTVTNWGRFGGNVGIGTTSVSSYALNILGSAYVSGDLTAGGSIISTAVGYSLGDFGVQGNLGAGTTSPQYRLDVQGSGNVILNMTGNVGIGTTNPSYTLDLYTKSTTPSIGETKYGLRNLITSNGQAWTNIYGTVNTLTSNSGYGPAWQTPTAYASYNSIADSGTRTAAYGVYNNIACTSTESNKVYGIYNNISSSATASIESVGAYNNVLLTGQNSTAYGDYTSITASTGSGETIYGNYIYGATTVNNQWYGTFRGVYVKTDTASPRGNHIAYQASMDASVDSEYGLYLEGETQNYLSGNLGIGYTNPGPARLAVNGNLGIGTTNPTAALEVGTTRLGYPSLFVTAGNNVGIATTAPTGRLEVGTTTLGYPSLFVTAGGYVGIGTTRPITKLDVLGDIQVQGDDGWNDVGDLAKILLGSGANSNDHTGIAYEYAGGIVFDVYKASGGGKLGTNTLDAMFIQEISGNVGIGTTLPTGLLEVGTTKRGYPSLFVTAGGNVGIGTTAPTAKLEVAGNLIANTATLNRLTVADNIGIGTSSPLSRLHLVASGTGTASALRIQDFAGVDKVTVLDNGNVGIGSTSPTAPMEITTSAAGTVVPFKVWGTGANYVDFTVGKDSTHLVSTEWDAVSNLASITTTGIGFPLWLRGSSVNIYTASSTAYGLEFGTNANSPRIDFMVNSVYSTELASVGTDTLLKNTVDNSGNILFSTKTSAAMNTRMAIANGGNVGIGTTLPLKALDISQATGQNLRLAYGTSTTLKTDFTLDSAGEMTITSPTGKTPVFSPVVWDELPPVTITTTKTGSSVPTLTTFRNGIEAYVFDNTTDYVIGTTEVVHWYKEGTDIGPHVHWATNGSEASIKAVTWQIEYTVANMNNLGVGATFPASTTISTKTEIPANTPDRTHMFTDMTDIGGTNIKVGNIIVFKFNRIASGTEPAANPFALSIGFHAMKDTAGSRTETVK